MTSAATDFTARRTATSASRSPRSWTGRSTGLNQIVLHLGNGDSASAIAGGRPVDTSMGLTPLEGLVMGTRSGDIDPGVVSYLSRRANMSVDEIESMLNHRSGVLGLSGERDFRRLEQMVESGDASAKLAYDVFIHRLRKYIGAYLAVLGHTDVLTFTAGIGENDGGGAPRRGGRSGRPGSRDRRGPQSRAVQGAAFPPTIHRSRFW